MIPEAAQDVEVGHDLGLWLRPDARHPAGQGRSVELGPLGQGIQPPLPQDVLDVQAGAGHRGGQGAEFEGTAERPRIRRHPPSML